MAFTSSNSRFDFCYNFGLCGGIKKYFATIWRRLPQFLSPPRSCSPPRHLFPRKIHQSWKTCQAFKLPAHRLFTSLWRQQYPDWEYTCWDDEANRNLVATAMPQFLEAYEGYTQGVEKADFTRAIYMYVHGGLYVDYDFLPVGRMDSYLESLGEYGIVLGAMGKCKD